MGSEYFLSHFGALVGKNQEIGVIQKIGVIQTVALRGPGWVVCDWVRNRCDSENMCDSDRGYEGPGMGCA